MNYILLMGQEATLDYIFTAMKGSHVFKRLVLYYQKGGG